MAEKWGNKALTSIENTIEQTILAIPALIFTILGNPGPLFSAIKYALIGWVWLLLGDYLISHTHILKDILKLVQDFSGIVSLMFDLDIGAIIVAVDVFVAAFNVVAKVVDFFTGSNTIPQISGLPLTIPKIDFTDYIKSIEDFTDAATQCAAFDSVWYELTYPLRGFLNDAVCPVVRYTWGTLIEVPFGWLLSLFYFNADPNDPTDGNCTNPDFLIVCFILKFGSVILYVLAPLHIIFWLYRPISKAVWDAIDLAADLFRFSLAFLIDVLHDTLGRHGKKKSKWF